MPSAKQEASAEGPAGLLDLRFELLSLSLQERDAGKNIVNGSRHTRLTIMPNHCMSIEGELEGFTFTCALDDPASVLPLTKSSMSTTAIYECMQDNGASYLRLSRDVGETTRKLAEIIGALEQHHDTEALNLDCMPELDFSALKQHTFKDQR
jgi:hypothetical protein